LYPRQVESIGDEGGCRFLRHRNSLFPGPSTRAATGRAGWSVSRYPEPTGPSSRTVRSLRGLRDGAAHVLERLLDGLLVLERGVGVVLDRLGDVRVERRDRARLRAVEGRLEGLHVGELLLEPLVVVDR